MTRHPVAHLTGRTVMDLYGLSRTAAYKAVKRGWVDTSLVGKRDVGRPAKLRKPAGYHLPSDVIERIALHTAKYCTRDYDQRQEVAQLVRIELWTSGADTEALAYRIALRAGRKAFRQKNIYTLIDYTLDEELLRADADGAETTGQSDLGDNVENHT